MSEQNVAIWLDKILPHQTRLTNTSVDLITKLTSARKIDCLSITGRTRSKEDALEKIDRKKYSKPEEQLTDLSGVRIIVYFESQIQEISELIKDAFEVDDQNSMDRNQVLGEDKIGYRSVHFVCTLGADREKLPEYESLKGLKVEFQIRTILQHAWAELAHDGSYKFAGTLPSVLQRRLNLYSGMLEIVDQGFNEISSEIDKYKEKLETMDISSIEDSDIDSINLEKFISHLSKEKDLGIPGSMIKKDGTIVKELREFGVTKLSELSNLISEDFIKLHKEHISQATDVGFLRDLLMFVDIDKYFGKSYQHGKWGATDEEGYSFLVAKYGKKKINLINDQFNIEVEYLKYEPGK